MTKLRQIQWFTGLFTACVVTIAAATSCDTPQTIAWSYYECARDTLAAGDPYAAKRFLKACNKTTDKELALKADSLMEVINRAIENNK